MTPWGEIVADIISARKSSLRSVAQLLGVPHSFLSRAMHGRLQYKDGPTCKPPIEKLEEWAETLGLTGAARDRFIEAGELQHAPERIAKRYLAQQARIRELAERISKLERQ